MKKALVVFLVLVAFASAVTFAARRLPVHYAVRSRPIRLARLSRGEEAFIFIEEQRWGRASSVATEDRKSTRLNSSHVAISYAVFCLKKKNTLISRTGLSPAMAPVSKGFHYQNDYHVQALPISLATTL